MKAIAKSTVRTGTIILSGLTLILTALCGPAAAVSPLFGPAGSMAVPRANDNRNGAVAVLLNNKILVAGGVVNGATGAATTDAELYDPLTGKFTKTGPLSVARSDHTATTLP